MREIGVRALREQLHEVLAGVQAGETVIVTNHGTPIARIEPHAGVASAAMQQLLRTGRVTWGGGRLQPLEPQQIEPGPDVAAILLAQRSNEPLEQGSPRPE